VSSEAELDDNDQYLHNEKFKNTTSRSAIRNADFGR
jgi:hypothetical protein